MDTLCVTCQNVKIWDALSRFGPERDNVVYWKTNGKINNDLQIWTRNMNAGKLHAIQTLKYLAKYAYSTISRSTSMASCVSVVKWIPLFLHKKKDTLFKFPSEARIVSCLLQGVHPLTWSQIYPPSHKCHINTPFLRVRSQVKKTLKSHANSLSDAIRLCPHPQKKESPAA